MAFQFWPAVLAGLIAGAIMEGPRYNSATPFVIQTAGGRVVVRVDQRLNGGRWVSLGTYTLNAGDYDVVGVSRWTSTAG
ncbi:MAG: hypothetical protein M3Q65_08835, partial [Chloroflexota bacterium]|nr:hypothetical protein [Chloroflexota bacterium]